MEERVRTEKQSQPKVCRPPHPSSKPAPAQPAFPPNHSTTHPTCTGRATRGIPPQKCTGRCRSVDARPRGCATPCPPWGQRRHPGAPPPPPPLRTSHWLETAVRGQGCQGLWHARAPTPGPSPSPVGGPQTCQWRPHLCWTGSPQRCWWSRTATAPEMAVFHTTTTHAKSMRGTSAQGGRDGGGGGRRPSQDQMLCLTNTHSHAPRTLASPEVRAVT